jgi:hypothetical protein
LIELTKVTAPAERSFIHLSIFKTDYRFHFRGHLTGEDYQVLRAVLRKYRHLFYQEGSMEIGCTSQVKHTIETRDARPINKNPYRHVEAHVNLIINHYTKKNHLNMYIHTTIFTCTLGYYFNYYIYICMICDIERGRKKCIHTLIINNIIAEFLTVWCEELITQVYKNEKKKQ